MAKEIKFNVKLLVDGKEQLATATASTKELREQLYAAQTAADKFRNNLITLNQSVERLQNLSNGAKQIANAFNSMTEECRTFSAAMNAANTMAGKSGEDFTKLKESVAELATTIPLTRDALANGLYQVISNGVPEDNWITYLKESAKASVGGIADLGETVKVTSTIIKNYGLSWDKAGAVQDKIQLTAKNGVTSFEQLAQALPRVTGNAATLGVSIDELMATFATLTGVSGNTAEVSTQLAAVFTALVKPSSEATKMAQQMGIEFDAAAIKAAGGMRNFLTDLDKSINAYASKSGMLEQEIYGKLFGSAESLRALIPLTGKLSEKFNANVEEMKDSAGTIDDAFDAMSSSGAACFQMLQNKISAFTDGIMSAMSQATPYLNITAQVGESAIALTSLIKVLRAFAAAQIVVKTRIAATNAVSLIWNATSVRMNALVKVMSASFRGAAVSAKTLKFAIQGLLISTGVGVAVWALTEAISYLATSSDEATKGLDDLSAAEEQAKAAKEQEAKQIAEITAALDINISKLKNFKGSKEDEKKIVAEMNNTYGDTMGYYSTVSQWYEALIGNSKAYCNQMINEVRIRDLANKAAELAQKKHDITTDEQGKPRKYSAKDKTKKVAIGQYSTTAGTFTQYADQKIEGSSDLAQATKKYKEYAAEERAVREQMDALVKQNANIKYNHYNGYQKGKPDTAPTKTTGAGTPTKDPKTYVEELQAKLSEAKKEMENATTIDAKVVAETKVNDIQRQIDEATKGKVTIEAETESGYIVQGSDADKRKSRSNAQSKISSIQNDYEIGIIDADKAKKQIDDINAELVKLGVKPIEVHFKTQADELREQLKDAQREFADAATIDAKIKADAKITELQSQIDKATKGQLTIEVEVEPAYIVRGSDADKRQSYSNAQSKAGRIQNDYDIGLIDKDQAQAQIDDLNKQIEGLGSNLKPLTLQIDTTGVDQAQQKMQGACDAASAMGSSLSGLGNAIGVPELNIAGTLAQGIATMVQGYAAATKQAAALGPWAWIAFAATGLAQLTAMITAVQGATGFATGGIIGGSSTSGDKKFARVNSGEMILNKFQQARLFNMVSGQYQAPTFYDRHPQPMVMQNISNIEPSQTMVNIHLNANARKMLNMMSDTKRVTTKSGRRYSV